MEIRDIVNEKWTQTAISWEYSKAASPKLGKIPIKVFPASLHERETTGLIPLDLSSILETSYSATSPNLLANYITIASGEKIESDVVSSSEVFFVIRGSGYTETEYGKIRWQQGDSFSLPSNRGAIHYGDENSALYWVHDAPLLAYLGVAPVRPRFEPGYYSREYLNNKIEEIREIGIKKNLNRNGIILGNTASEKTRTMTHTMWSLYNLLPKKSSQKPHRHNSVAIDLAISASGNTYTLIGNKIDEFGNIINPTKVMWEANTVFVTPPGLWHSHHNESDEDAYVFPIQDAGIQSYMRTLEIQFA